MVVSLTGYEIDLIGDNAIMEAGQVKVVCSTTRFGLAHSPQEVRRLISFAGAQERRRGILLDKLRLLTRFDINFVSGKPYEDADLVPETGEGLKDWELHVSVKRVKLLLYLQ